MFNVHRWIRNLNCIGCFLGVLIGSFLPAMAQFLPEKGVVIHYIKQPKEAGYLQRYFWLNDHEVVYVKPIPGPDSGEQYRKLDLTTGKEQVLLGLTKLVRDTTGVERRLPHIHPSPDKKYLAWAGTSKISGDTLLVATTEGSIISRTLNKTFLSYISWSADSKWCFCFLHGEVADEPIFGLPADLRTVFNAIVGVSVNVPTVVKTYPIALKPERPHNFLSGYQGFTLRPYEAPVLLPDFYFGSSNNILLMSPKSGELTPAIQFTEYNITETTMPVQTHIWHLPALWKFEYAVVSPQGNAIVWKFSQEDDDEFWITDSYGGNLKRIGKLHPSSLPVFLNPEGDYMKWLPNGKAISFIDGEGLCVVYLDVNKSKK